MLAASGVASKSPARIGGPRVAVREPVSAASSAMTSASRSPS
jgi:hypothetical protein